VLLAACLVFLMQGGFLLLEIGSTRPEHGASVGLKNLVDWVVATVAFGLVGFGLAFGASATGLIGTDLFGLGFVGSEPADGPAVGMLVFFLFQLGFAATAITIVSGAMAERTGFVAYMAVSGVTALLIYPVVAHWVWGGTVFGDTRGWLAELGFLDFAGATVVHSVGAWIALVGIWVVGPRLGRYAPDGSVRSLPGAHLGLSALGVLVLWIGWWGFNGGSTLRLDSSVPVIILVTGLAGAAGALAALLDAHARSGKRGAGEKLLGGALAGLVAVTACADVISPAAALGLGAVAGVLHNVVYDGLHRWRLDDPVGAVAVHGAGGVLGTLAVAFVTPAGSRPLDLLPQLGVQALGVLVVFAWSAGTAYVVFRVLRATVGLRVSPAQERSGDSLGIPLHVAVRPVAAPAPAVVVPEQRDPDPDVIDDDELAELLS
jgi:Amt family ammonium transporter